MSDRSSVWPTVRLKYLATVNDETLKESTDPDYELAYLDIGSVGSQGELSPPTNLTFEKAPSRARRIARDGDVIISTVRTYLTAIASIKDAPDNLVVSTGFAVVRPRPSKLDPHFCKYALRDPGFISNVKRLSVGVSYPAINVSDLVGIKIPAPPLDQQRAIAAHLDLETARLDTLADGYRHLIERLAEKRRALVARAVTRGLDAEAETEDSGVEWLGEVPAHWEVMPLKRVAQVRGGLAKGRQPSGPEVMTVPYLRVANVQDGYLDLETITEIEIEAPELERYLLQKGDLLMNEGGDSDKLGRGAVWNGSIDPCIHQNHVFAVRCHGINPEWLALLSGIDASKAYFEIQGKQTTNLASISSSNLRELPVLVPPPAEQTEIVAHVKYQSAAFNALAAEAEAALALLAERRGALIAEAVSGKNTAATA